MGGPPLHSPFTTIASFREPHAAHIARAKLEAEGIPAFLADEHLAGVQWLYSDAIGGVKLCVPSDYAEEAREVISRDHSADLRGVDTSHPALALGDACPSCGSPASSSTRVSRETQVRPYDGRGPLVLWTNRRHCKECGTAW